MKSEAAMTGIDPPGYDENRCPRDNINGPDQLWVSSL
jgi:hypothetical protein